MPESDLGSVERATAIVNPISSTSKRGRRRLERLVKASPFEITTISTSRFPDKTNAIIRSALETSDLLLVVAGDGTFNRVVNIITANGLSDEAKRVPVWSIGGGNAEDGAKAKHTKIHRRNPERVLSDGRLVETHPIRFDVLEPGETEEKTYAAAFYATMGMTALAASEEYMNRPQHRRHLGKTVIGRMISEPPLALRALAKAEENTVLQDGQERQFYEEIFANSHIMAKYFRFQTGLTKPELFHTVIPEKKITSIVPAVIRGSRGTLPGDYLGMGESMAFETRHDLYAQFDGETTIIPSDSHVKVSIHEEPIRVVVSNPDL